MKINTNIKTVFSIGFVLTVLLAFTACAGCVQDENTSGTPVSGIWVKEYSGGETFIYEIKGDGQVTEILVLDGEVYKVPHKLVTGDDGSYMIGENRIVLSEDGKTLTEILPSGSTIVYQKNNGYRIPAETAIQQE
ncbi:MAG TPA: hypothetical protein O0X97_01985 [Methanocorpusculum sp.]|nr:hypothetical protein [Methanocorpusculum sp.]